MIGLTNYFPPAWTGLPDEARALYDEDDGSDSGNGVDDASIGDDDDQSVFKDLADDVFYVLDHGADAKAFMGLGRTKTRVELFTKWYMSAEKSINARNAVGTRIHKEQRRANRRYLDSINEDAIDGVRNLANTLQQLLSSQQARYVPMSGLVPKWSGGRGFGWKHASFVIGVATVTLTLATFASQT